MKKKILFVYYQNIKQGGISKAIAKITENLAYKDIEITILFLMSEHEDFFQIDSRVRKIYLDTFDTTQYRFASALYYKRYFAGLSRKLVNYSYDLGSFLMLKKWISENHQNYDQIISCWYKLSTFLTFTEAKKKVIAWEHINYKTGGLLYYQWLRKRYSKLKGIICLTDEAVKFYKTINSNTVKISNIIGDDYENAAINFSEKENNIFLACRLEPEKNIDEFLEIVSMTKMPENWTVNIAGNGAEFQKLTEKTVALGLKNVKFLGSINSDMMVDHFKKSKIFCMTSVVEGLPTTLIEAMFCGNVLISYDCPTGPAEIINNRNGYLIPLHDKYLFKEKLQYLIYNGEGLELLMRLSLNESINWGKADIIEKWKKMLSLEFENS
ncbi:glycosyltransferase [Epilithonimonas sp. JDS]|uniref:glycosyltransferase n=1 Tax=Epilithonimonas sp. JDS TaxID=2902797 RepID=UPI001E3A641C|nr:glycosyltransferase [Epilithonimonas sp. JDS]MCD9855166.1 glycosyltransferase [Epilithonimonas sp. JDS]